MINLSKPILITKESNPSLLSDFIIDRIRIASENYFLDEDIIDMLDLSEGPGVIIRYSEINIY